jgi:protein SCO1/2
MAQFFVIADDQPPPTESTLVMTESSQKRLPRWPWILLVVGLTAAALAYVLTPTPAPRNATSGSSLIGGKFTLTDQNGHPYTEANLKGHYSVIYFGYTFCPDVCPTELQNLSQALDLLKPDDLAKVQPIFITVDPERDTPEVMAKYIKAFHPKLIGLTGTPEQVASAEKAYLIYAAKAVVKNGDPKSYLMDHVSILYVMGPDGKNVTHFGPGTPPEKIADTLTNLLK